MSKSYKDSPLFKAIQDGVFKKPSVITEYNGKHFTWNIPIDRKDPPRATLIRSLGNHNVMDEEGRVWDWRANNGHVSYRYLCSIISEGQPPNPKRSRFRRWEAMLNGSRGWAL